MPDGLPYRMKPIDSPLELAQFMLAGVAFSHAKVCLRLVLSDTSEELQTTAYGAMCGYYSRPFLNNQGGFKRWNAQDIVPPELLDVHNELLAQRNQAFMHTDVGVNVADKRFANTFDFVSKNGVLVVQKIPMLLKGNFIAEIPVLLDRVQQAVNAMVMTCLDTFSEREFRFPAGSYRLNLAANAGDFVHWFTASTIREDDHDSSRHRE